LVEGGGQPELARGCVRKRREPERTLLHELVRDNLRTFLAEREGPNLPRFVREEFERYLACGILSEGFARVHCDACGHDELVAFSCKRRGFCPSCNARRMHDTAAHLVERVFPQVPVRQWVLSLPRWARWLLARDSALASRALAITLRAIFSHHRRGAPASRCGAVTFVQRFGSALNLNVHFHCVLPDGVFVREGGPVRFLPATPPEDEELKVLLRRIVRRLQRLLRPRVPAHESDLEAIDREYAASVESLPRGQFIENAASKRHSAFLDGFSLHAGVHLHENNREGLSHLCGYGARGPLSLHRLSLLPDGRVLYKMKRPMAGGRLELVLTPVEFLRKLATLIPPPRKHSIRFHGIFAPNSSWRKEIVPAAAAAPAATAPKPAEEPATPTLPLPSRIPWAELFRRVFKADVLSCARCAGRMRVIAYLSDRESVSAILKHLELPTTGPPIAPARLPDSYFDAA
jgi:hypothetical protein